MYATSLLNKENIKALTLHTSTVDCYLFVATKVIRSATLSRGIVFLDPRYDQFGTKSPDLAKVINENKRWEKMPSRREPVTITMLMYMAQARTNDADCLFNAHLDWQFSDITLAFAKTNGAKIPSK